MPLALILLAYDSLDIGWGKVSAIKCSRSFKFVAWRPSTNNWLCSRVTYRIFPLYLSLVLDIRRLGFLSCPYDRSENKISDSFRSCESWLLKVILSFLTFISTNLPESWHSINDYFEGFALYVFLMCPSIDALLYNFIKKC